MQQFVRHFIFNKFCGDKFGFAGLRCILCNITRNDDAGEAVGDRYYGVENFFEEILVIVEE